MHARRFRTEVRRLGYLVMTCFFVPLELSPHVEDSSAVYCELCRIKHLLYLTSVFSYNLDFTAGASRPCKIFNFQRRGCVWRYFRLFVLLKVTRVKHIKLSYKM